MMNRLADHAKNRLKETGQSQDDSLEDIFEQFQKAVRDVFALKKYTLTKCLELAKGLIEFTINFYKNNKEKIEQILECVFILIEDFQEDLNKDIKASQGLIECLLIPLNYYKLDLLEVRGYYEIMTKLKLEDQFKLIDNFLQEILKSKKVIRN